MYSIYIQLKYEPNLKITFIQIELHQQKHCMNHHLSHPLVNSSHGRVRMTVAAWSMANLPVGQPLIGGPFRTRWDNAQNLQLELQGVVGRGGWQADAGHLLRRLDGEEAFTNQL